ncbi:hypothetical protein DOY81_010545, partial [Sarcophaga bullata]
MPKQETSAASSNTKTGRTEIIKNAKNAINQQDNRPSLNNFGTTYSLKVFGLFNVYNYILISENVQRSRYDFAIDQ